MTMPHAAEDYRTAQAFADSWNHLPQGSVYTSDQFQDWFAPLGPEDVRGKSVLELGCGNGSLLVHMLAWKPASLTGIDLGDSVRSARDNLRRSAAQSEDVWRVEQADLTTYRGEPVDVAYCIGVLHHLRQPLGGLQSVVANIKPGGRFHCWVYAKEGNALVRFVVEPLRRVCCRLPWWVTKYLAATPLVFPFFLCSKLLALLPRAKFLKSLPLYEYALWISSRGFAFYRHVAFDQLVTPQTAYISRKQIEDWLRACPEVDPDSVYVLLRNGNSWKFGGRRLLK